MMSRDDDNWVLSVGVVTLLLVVSSLADVSSTKKRNMISHNSVAHKRQCTNTPIRETVNIVSKATLLSPLEVVSSKLFATRNSKKQTTKDVVFRDNWYALNMHNS